MKTSTIGWNFANLRFNSFFSRAGKINRSMIVLLSLSPLISIAQQIKLEQGQNGGVSRPAISPVNWSDGNSYDENSHFIEGQSIPYRVAIKNVAPGNHSLIIEWDTRKDGKSAIDYITDYQRIPETVNPLKGLSGNYGSPSYFTLPVPQRNTSVAGSNGTQSQPIYSFNQLTNNEKRITLYNGTPVGISYSNEGDPTKSYSSTKLKLEFKVTGHSSKNIVIAWGGHIASRLDWGAANASHDNYSSPYKMRIVSFDRKDFPQERSLKNSAVTFIPSCEVLGNKTFCEDITYTYTVKTNVAKPHFEWTITGGTLLSGQGKGEIQVSWLAASNTGKVSVKITDKSNSKTSGKPSTCSLLLTRDMICPYYPPQEDGKANTLIGSELTSLSENFDPANPPESNFIYSISNDKVLIEVISTNGQYNALLALLKSPAYGLTGEIDNDNSMIITGYFPIANLPLLDNLPNIIRYVRPAFPPIQNAGTITSKGDIAQHTNLSRAAYGIDGTGIKVGVLSDSYNLQPGNPALANVLNDDLPNNVRVLKESPIGGTDEGRAMLQIIHDIAPKAKLAFRTATLSSGDFAKGIKELLLDTCDIIVDDLTYLTEPFFQDGQVAKAVDFVTSQNVTYFTAAGNFANRSYESTFVSAPAPSGITGVAHNFGGGDTFQKITVGPGTYTIVLQWDDQIYSLGGTQTGAAVDLDIYLTTEDGSTLFGFNRNNLGGDPIEVLPFTVKEQASTNIMIVSASGPTNIKFKYIVFRGDQIVFNEYNTGSSTIVGQANAKGAITVGAVLYSNTAAFNYTRPAGDAQFAISSYSSIGGNLVQGEDRLKPDIIAPAGVNTTVQLGGLDVDYDVPQGSDGFYNFFGTSAAAPHAAGLAALLLHAQSKFYNGSKLTPHQIRQTLIGSALDMHEPGRDVKSGAGFIQADASLATIAAPKPEITALTYDTNTITPGESEFVLTVEGRNLTNASKVLFRGTPLTTSFIKSTQLEATIPAFDGNPPIQVITNSISPSALDGGVSDSLFFFGITKRNVTVIAGNKTKKYGERLPSFTATVLVDGDTATATSGPALIELGLNNLEFTTPANSLSNADKYVITVNKEIPVSLKELYNYTFVNGLLTIEKMPLKITPDNLQAVYGEKFDDKITLSYVYDNSKVENNQTFLNTLELDHKSILAENAIALVDSRAIVNKSRALVNADLENLSFLTSSRALVNSRAIVNRSRAIVNTTNVVDFDKQSMLEYLENPDTANLITPVFNSRAIVNKSRALVNSRAIVNSRAVVNYSRALVNRSRALVNSRAIVNSGAVVNSQTVGADSVTSNRGAVIIIDSLDIFNNDTPIIENGIAYYELPAIFAINTVTGLTAGTHFIIPGTFLTDLSNNFDVSYGLGTITIFKDTLTATTSSAEIIYGAAQPQYSSELSVFKYDDTAETVVKPITYKLKDTYGNLKPSTGVVPAGIYKIIPVVELIPTDQTPGEPVNYLLKYSYGTLTVKKAPLSVKADNKTVLAGETPVYTSTITGLVNGDAPSSWPVYATSPKYTGNVGTYSINPSNLRFSIPGNYDITYISGVLDVKPNPKHAKAIKPILSCIEEVKGHSNFKYRARFEYQNDNSTEIFIPIGHENKIDSERNYSGKQPETFLPGGGTFEILFNGDKLRWTVVSYDKGKKVSNTVTASHSSQRCQNGGGSYPTYDELLKGYPNPTKGPFSVVLPEATREPSLLEMLIVDQFLRPYLVSREWDKDKKILTFDLSSLPKGWYVIKIRVGYDIKLYKVFKE